MTRRYFDDDVQRAKRRDTRPRDERLLSALREWERLRRYALRLKQERIQLAIDGCDNRPEFCFKMQDPSTGYYMPLAERCRACRQSYAVHLLWKETSLAAGVELRRLRRLLKGEHDALRDQAGLRQAG